ncbi:MAG: hypothetical protein AAGH46_01980, partial [Bacteroidota bacterium]
MYSIILRKVFLPIGDFITGGNYLSNLKKWKAYDNYTESQLLNLQAERLNNILKHCSESVPFYK